MFFKQVMVVAVLTFSATFDSLAGTALGVDASLRADLQRVAQQRIYFGHQSVGGNLLDGIRELASKAGVPIHIAEAKSASGVGAATLGHTFIAENRNPIGKLQAFDQAMGPNATGLNVAFMKFCYLDFTPETDVQALFARYRATVDAIRNRNPGMTLVHVTTPLTVVQDGPKAFLKRLLGRAPYGALENLRREEYNTLLRQTYKGREPIFDLARVEITAPDGTPVTSKWDGVVVPALTPAYTDDGGHLNGTGRMRASRELVSVLAAIPIH